MRIPRLLAAVSLLATLVSPVRPAAAAPKPYMFIAYGDTRSHADVHRAVIARIVAARPQFVLQTGDLVDTGHSAAQWTEFDAIEKPLHDAHIGYYPSRGNHDLGPYYRLRAPQKVESGNGYYYAFTRETSRFIAVDSMDPDGVMPDSPQYRWLESELAKAQGKAAHTFVFFHESPYSVGPHGPDGQAAKYLAPLFDKYRVTAVFCGHDHLYYRTVRNGIHYFVTGGGGAPLYQPENAALAITGDVYASVYHYITLEVKGRSVTATAYEVDPKGVDADKVIDRVTWAN